MSTLEVKFKELLELTARRQMIFHHLRISAALKAYQKDLQAGRQRWWIENLKFELNNALTFVGLCTTQDWNVPVPDLIRLLAQALSSKTDSSVLSASQVWEELSSDKSDLTDQLNLAWWAHPGGGKGCFTFDELNEAFEQYLQKVPQSMAETEQLGDQRADSQRKLQDEIASFISSIEDARKKNRKEIQDHQAAIHASAFLSKKYKASGVVPSRSQLESYAAEFNDFMKFADANERPNEVLDGVHDEVAKPAADNLAANHSR